MPELLPIAIIIPHAGLAVPPELAGALALSDAQIFNEADAYADRLYDFRKHVLAWEAFPWSRAVLDVNRPLEHALNRPGDGIVKRRTSYGAEVWRPGKAPDPALEAALIDRYWRPWHAQLAAIAADPRVQLVIDGHSMAAIGPDAYNDPAQARPRVAVANWGDARGESLPGERPVTAPPALARWWSAHLGALLADVPARAAIGAPIGLNHPFKGGAGLRLHGGARQPWLMVEVSRALYIGDQGGGTPAVPADDGALAALRERLWQGIVQLVAHWQASDVS